MALTSTTKNYEILVRFSATGEVAAHKQDIVVIKEENDIVGQTELAPAQLSVEELKTLIADL